MMNNELFEILCEYEALRAVPDPKNREEFEESKERFFDLVVGKDIVSATGVGYELENLGTYLGTMVRGRIQTVWAEGFVDENTGDWLTPSTQLMSKGKGDFVRLGRDRTLMSSDLELWNERKQIYGKDDEFFFGFDRGSHYTFVLGKDPFNTFLSLDEQKAKLVLIEPASNGRFDMKKGHLLYS